MNCDCVKNVNEKLKNQTGDPEAGIDIDFVIIKNQFVSLPKVAASWRRRKKDGTLKAKPDPGSVFFQYCPFCGYRIQKEEKEAAS